MASFRNLLGLPVKLWDNRAAGQVLQLSSDKEHWEFVGGTFTVSTLPATTAIGAIAFASDGRKSGEGTGTGTGCPVWWNGSAWLTFYDNTTVAA